MTKNCALYITATDIYVEVTGEGKPEYWKQSWDQATWAASVGEIKSTLPSTSVNLILGTDLPLLMSGDRPMVRTLTETEDTAALVESYRTALATAGIIVSEVKHLSELGLPADATPQNVLQAYNATPSSPMLSTSLEDLGIKKASKFKMPFVAFLIFVVLIGLVAIAGYWFAKKPGVMTPSPTPVASVQPTPAPSPVVASPNNADFSVKIFNGSGIVGLAGKFSAKIEGLGFKVESTGNADKFDYTTTILRSGKTIPASVITSLRTILPAGSLTEALEGSPSANIEIILGKDAI